MTWVERQLERLRSLNPLAVDSVLAVVLTTLAIATVHSQEVVDGLSEPTGGTLLTILASSAPVAIRRVMPLSALTIGCIGILVHVVAGWPEGTLPISVLLLTYSVAARDLPRFALVGLGVVYATLLALGFTDTPGLDTLGVLGNLAMFTGVWCIGIALRARRETLEARVRAADQRADAERQATARALAEERLRIAQELHDVVAHSMSVIAVQAGVGAHVLADRPEQARAALDAISATSRGTLTEMRRLLGVLRDSDGERSHAPAPGLADVPRLVDDVRAAGVPVTLTVDGAPVGDCVNGGVELSAYRVVQEALTNVIKHAGTTTQVDVTVHHGSGCLAVEIVDDGRGATALQAGVVADGAGHGHVGMRERVELWGGALSVGPLAGGGYRVLAELPYGDSE